ncbi:hypothetical protein ES703_25828 [subsurface metagenome]
MSLDSLLMDRFKVRTRAVENPKVSQVETTATLVLSNNPDRLGWILYNLGANPIFVATKNTVAADTYGGRADANGGFVSMIWDEDFHATGWAIWAIAKTGASKIWVLEIVEY